MTEQDISNFSTSSPHRLPTVSASQALQNASARSHSLTTGLKRLDSALVTPGSAVQPPGIHRGHVTEIYGPPGVGKTALAMQVAVNTLQEHGGGGKIVWIDTGAPISGGRFQDILARYRLPPGVDPPSSPPVARTMAELSTNVTYFYVRTLPHLLTLFMYPTPVFPPPNTSLVVVDNVSALFATYFPRSSEATITTSAPINPTRKTSHQRAVNRKFTIAGDLASAMAKTAALQNVAILAINQVATSLKGVRKAVLKPVLSGTAWEGAMYNRIVLFRDFAPVETNDMVASERNQEFRFAEVLKSEGKAKARTAETVAAFVIEDWGLREVHLTPSPFKVSIATTGDNIGPVKRKADEIGDSEDEGDEPGSDHDFGLADEYAFLNPTAAEMDDPREGQL